MKDCSPSLASSLAKAMAQENRCKQGPTHRTRTGPPFQETMALSYFACDFSKHKRDLTEEDISTQVVGIVLS